MGLEASAGFSPSAEQIEWRLLSCVLPANAKNADKVLSEAASFAARAGLPARIELTVKTSSEDERFSKVIKTAALASGGRNRLKLDHVIASDKPRRIVVEVLSAR
jgi:hypothetical protein